MSTRFAIITKLCLMTFLWSLSSLAWAGPIPSADVINTMNGDEFNISFGPTGPALGSDTFQFAAQGIEAVQIQVFALSGQLIYTHSFAAGHTFRWNLRNVQSQRLASGLRLYEAAVKAYDDQIVHTVKKFVLLR